jgi:hypothetical protein
VVKKAVKRLLVGAAALAVLAVGGFFGYMQLVKGGYLRYNEFDRRERGTLREGGPAADVPLTMYDGSPQRLSWLWQRKPLFLVFGSCT